MVLLATTFGASLYPVMVAFSHQAWPVVLYAGIFGIFNAGLNLVFFDELMKRVPISYSATFIAAAQGLSICLRLSRRCWLPGFPRKLDFPGSHDQRCCEPDRFWPVSHRNVRDFSKSQNKRRNPIRVGSR